jgi:molybdate transport system regulatory protein
MAGKLRKKPEIKPRLRVLHGPEIAIGPGKMELLAQLAETGSLNEAARRLDMSYMRAWTLMSIMNKCFRKPVAVARRGGKTGGGMQVTDTGRKALELYQRMEQSCLQAVQPDWRAMQKLLRV